MTSGLLSLGCILYADGAANAASGPAQYPTLLSGYVKRAPFNVSGVDYRAGYSSSQTLTDWQSISQTGVTVNTGTNTVTVTGSNVTLSGIDFSLHGGAYVVISGATSTTITNSNFAYTGTAPTTPPITIGSSAINTTISYCVIDGNGVNSDPTPAGIFRINAATNVTIKYCYVKNASEDFVDIGDSAGPSGTLTVMYNLWESNGMGTYSPNHPDFLQILATNLSFITYNYNTFYLPLQNAPDTQGIMVDASSGAATPFEIGYNTMVFSTNAQVSAITGVGTPNSNAGLHSISNGVGTVHDNYINPAHPSGGFAPSIGYPGSSYAGLSTYSNNVNMVDGTLFTNTP